MSLVISTSLTLTDIIPGYPANNPRVGYHNLVTAQNLSADSSQDDSPITNASNPSTREIWRSNSLDEQYVTIAASGDADYIGIARHNLASGGVAITVESTANGTDWDEVVEFVPDSDGPMLILFEKETKQAYRLKLTPDETYPMIGVIYLGELLTLQRRIYVGHTPISYGRQTQVSNGRGETGEFLGRVLQNTFLQTTIAQQNITPDFYREQMEPWLISALDQPFFFAWRPEDYPQEVGYCWAAGDATVSNARANGMMEFSLDIQGIT